IIAEAQCGKCVDIGDYENLADNIIAMASVGELADMGNNARKFFQRYFLREKLMDKFELYLDGGKEKFCEGITD
ncbi:MAG: hypothetical protein IIW23_02635, partial [Clostridia bacterium]|nr:hypothetical protein [Clostridia bacterium]